MRVPCPYIDGMMFKDFLAAATLTFALTLSGQGQANPAVAAGIAALRADDEVGTRAALTQTDDQIARDVILWHLLRARKGTFSEGEDFLRRNPDWPGLNLLRARVELDIPATIAPERIVAFFDGAPPRTSRGALMLTIALMSLNRETEAETVAIDAWLTMPMSAASEAGFLEIMGNLLRPFDAARLDAMTWGGDIQSAERTLARVTGPEAALARARIALRAGREGVDELIAAVPEGFRDHQGLAYERFRWRLGKSRLDGPDGALALLFAFDADADTLGNPSVWGQHRERLARSLMQNGRYEDAYRVAAKHNLPEGDSNISGNEWLAGYIALRFLDRPQDAAVHFRTFDGNVASPISKGRAGYWLGRALEASGDATGAVTAYIMGARYQTSFYGQLAAERANLPADPLLNGSEIFPPLDQTSFAQSSLLAAARLLDGLGERELAEMFLAELAESLPRAEIGSLLDVILDDLGDAHVALLVAKRAAQSGYELHRGYFPVTDLATIESPVAPELALSIARRESEFNPIVVSGAGAAGLMQLMPGTARDMAALVGVPYRQPALTEEPLYNARLGTAYLRELEAEFGLSPILIPAAYNAGPTRARRWSAEFGNPSDPSIDVIDWIEDVPYSETRNYIMRVSESLLPYHAQLTGSVEDVKLEDWLKDGYGDLAQRNN